MYLTIITTALVLTQIIRVVQNTIAIRKKNEFDEQNEYVMRVYGKLEKMLDSLRIKD